MNIIPMQRYGNLQKLHTEESYFKDREESDSNAFFKWGTERGMKFYYGIDGSGID